MTDKATFDVTVILGKMEKGYRFIINSIKCALGWVPNYFIKLLYSLLSE